MPQGTGSSSSNNDSGKQVIDFGQVRAAKLEEKRRKTERIFFKQLLSVYSVMGPQAGANTQAQMCPIDIIDVSEDGCSFQVPFNPEKPWPTNTSELPLRLYLSQDTFLEVHATIQNSRPCIENGARFVRFGCTIEKNTTSYPAYVQFVRFMKMYAEHAHKDAGDVTVFYL